jgi:hypothetical protein
MTEGTKISREVWFMLPDECKDIMKDIKYSFMDSISADVDDIINKSINKREVQRNLAADNLCREVRYQIANNIHNENKLFQFLSKWLPLAKKVKYTRP